MPVYTFRCKKCKYLFDDLAMNSVEEVRCPKCGRETERTVESLGRTLYQPLTKVGGVNWK